MEQKEIYEREIDLWQLVKELFFKIRKIVIIGLIFAIMFTGFKLITSYSSLSNQNDIKYVPVIDYLGQAKIFIGSDIDTVTAEAIRTYLTSNDVIQNVIGDLQLDETYSNIFNMINLQNSTDTMIYINVVGNEEELVQDITASLSTIGAKKISEKFSKGEVIILEPAYTNIRQYNKEVHTVVKSYLILAKVLVKYTIIGFVLGVFLATGLYLLLFMMDNTIKDEKDIAGYLGLPVLGKVSIIKGTNKSVIIGKRKRNQRLAQYSNE